MQSVIKVITILVLRLVGVFVGTRLESLIIYADKSHAINFPLGSLALP